VCIYKYIHICIFIMFKIYEYVYMTRTNVSYIHICLYIYIYIYMQTRNLLIPKVHSLQPFASAHTNTHTHHSLWNSAAIAKLHLSAAIRAMEWQRCEDSINCQSWLFIQIVIALLQKSPDELSGKINTTSSDLIIHAMIQEKITHFHQWHQTSLVSNYS